MEELRAVQAMLRSRGVAAESCSDLSASAISKLGVEVWGSGNRTTGCRSPYPNEIFPSPISTTSTLGTRVELRRPRSKCALASWHVDNEHYPRDGIESFGTILGKIRSRNAVLA
jgi:hypothetical protein